MVPFLQMAGFYQTAYNLLPGFLKRRINPLDHAIEVFARSAAEGLDEAVVIDAGAGEARFSRYFQGQHYIAVDSCAGEPGWDYSRISVHADLARMPFRSEVADVVLNTQVLEHVPEPGSVLVEIHRVLKPGGRVFLTAPQGWHEHQQPNDFFRFTAFALARLFRGAGFRDVEIKPLGGYFHYLGHRLTYIPKVLFQSRSIPVRILLFPVEIACLAAFCFLAPLACFYLDRFDRKKEFTLCYSCLAQKQAR